MNLNELEKRMDNWDEAKKIFAVVAELELMKTFGINGLNVREMLNNLNQDQIRQLCVVVTNEDREYTTWEALEIVHSFLTFIFAKIAEQRGFSELLMAITGIPLPVANSGVSS